MKKLLTIAVAISTSFAVTTVSAADYVWTMATDTTLDGTIDTQALPINVRMHQNRFVIENTSDRSVSTSTGYILDGTVDNVTYSSKLISFTNFRGDSTYEFQGHSIGNGQFQGTWYDNMGNSGDWLINTHETPPVILPPVDVSQIIVTPSTEYGQHPATSVFDGVLGNNNANVWIGLPDDADAELHLNLPEARKFVKYRMSRGYCSAPGYVAGTWKLYGSNDDVNFTLVDDVSVDQGALMSCTSLNEYVVDAPGSYKYYKFDFKMSSINTYTHTGVAIGELELDE